MCIRTERHTATACARTRADNVSTRMSAADANTGAITVAAIAIAVEKQCC